MPTIISHAVAGAALAAAFPRGIVAPRLIVLGAICSMVPDVDTVGFHFGIKYADVLGHRGFSHSLLFAFVLATLALLAVFPRGGPRARVWMVWLYLFLATASHGFLDAFTNDGLGIAFFSPFDTTRYFFPFRPIAVSPIGARFFSHRGLEVMWSEFKWVWLSSIVFALAACFIRRAFTPKTAQPS